MHMDITLWIITGALAVAFGAGGASQLLLTKEKYRSFGASQHWVDDFSAGKIKAIGTIKVIGAAGLILPPLTGVLPALSPIAACGLALVMAGAATTRFRRSEWGMMAGDVAYLLAFVFVAWGRFALAPYGG
ncbi:DoxX family protein [Microbacterium sp. NPDC056234]|uniref:DoxX family protein n=1 Tax=Microbacterium sp. NPDC056234 TaxID=3345757 RepID=UPI0035DE4876